MYKKRVKHGLKRGGSIFLVLFFLIGMVIPSMAVEITLWHGWTGADNTEMLQKAIARFNRENPEIKVVPTALPWDEFFSKWVVSAAAGNPPDVGLYHTSEIPQFAELGILLPLEDLQKKVGISWEGIPQTSRELCTYKGTLYAIPVDVHPLALYYHRDLAERAGLDVNSPPSTRTELLTWAKKLTIKGEQYGIGMASTGAAPRWTWFSWLYQNGGRFLNEEGKAAVDSKESAEALQLLVDLVNKYKVAPPGETDIEKDFSTKVIAMTFIGPWCVNMFLRRELDFMTAPMPVVFDKPAVWVNSHVLSLSKTGNKARQLAGMKFIKWFAENMLEPALFVGVVPISSKVREEFIKHERYKYYKAFVEELDYLVYEPQLPEYSEIFSFGKPTPLNTNIEAAFLGEKSVEEALKDMAKGINEILERH